MAPNVVVFDCANPVPEIWPWAAKAAGARIVATGWSDFPDQLNSSLVFPGLFRGALDVWARTITDEMAIAVAHELAGYAETRSIHADDILASMLDRGLSDLAPSRAEGPRPRPKGLRSWPRVPPRSTRTRRPRCRPPGRPPAFSCARG
jgi:malic enzyme